MGSYIVQLDLSAAFDRESHSGILFQLKSIGVGGCCPFVGNSSPTSGSESWLKVILVS